MNVMTKLFLAAVFCAAGAANAQSVHGVLRVVKGDVQIKQAKDGQTVKARLGAEVYPKDVIMTGKEARAKIVMTDNNEINVSPESQIEIQKYEFDPSKDKKDVLLNVIYGKVRSKVEQKYDGKENKFQVKTPSAVAGVRGTDFLTGYDQSNHQSQVVTFRGAVDFGTPGPGGSINNVVSVTPGMTSTSVAGAPPKPPTNVPKDKLANMDNDTKSEAGPGGKSDRAPSNEGGKKDKDRGPASTGGGMFNPENDQPGGTDDRKCGASCQPPPPPPPPPPANGCPGGVCPPPPPSSCPPVCPNGNTKVNVHLNH